MQQDADFLPYTVNGSLAPPPLPRTSLDGEINTFNTTWRINTRWDKVWGFAAQYRQNEQDNATPRATYDYVIADTALSSTARANFPYSFREREFLLQGRYQIDKQRHIKLDYEHAMNDRTYQEVESSDEDTLSATYRSDVNEQLQWYLRLKTSDREGGEYTPVTEIIPVENTLLRKYNIADRKRNLVAVSITLFADYSLDEKSVIHVVIGYEDYEEKDWAINGVVPNTLDNVLTLGEVSPSYDIGTFAVSYKRQF